MHSYFDLTLPLDEQVEIYPGDPEFVFEPVFQQSRGSPFNLGKFQMSTHTGTHIDAPCHFFSNNKAADSVPLNQLCGLAQVVQIGFEGKILPQHLTAVVKSGAERMLIGSRWDGALYPRPKSFLSESAARLLRDAGIRLLGIDSMSIDDPQSESFPAHRLLLREDVVAIENLDMRNIAPGQYELLCLPLRLAGADGAPARVVIRRT